MTGNSLATVSGQSVAVAQPQDRSFGGERIAQGHSTEMALARVDGIYRELADIWTPGLADRLRQDWGTGSVENLALAQALVDDHPDWVRDMERYGLADHPGMLALAPKIARVLGYRYGGRGGQRQSAPPPGFQGMSAAPTVDIVAEHRDLTDLRAQIAEAQAQGNSRLANELYRREQDAIARRGGNRVVVNGRRTA